MDTGLIHIPYMRPERTARQTFQYAHRMAIEAEARVRGMHVRPLARGENAS